MSRRYGVYALVLLCACSSNKPPVGGVGVDAAPQASGGLADGGTDASVDGGADASADGGEPVLGMPHHPVDDRPFSQRAEEDYGLTLTDEEKMIFDTCPRRPWSTKVPDRDCTKDAQCGEGFCDRGHCQAIYTCGQALGNRCLSIHVCYGICVDGRCRSCVSDEECDTKNREKYPNATRYSPSRCGPGIYAPGKNCGG